MDAYGFQRRHREIPNSNPSFSSTLLDAIYRSIDGGGGEEDLVGFQDSMRKKQSSCSALKGTCKNGVFVGDAAGFRRDCMIEKWMEEKVVVRRKSTAEMERKLGAWNYSSSSGSSDSSCGGGIFSSSEAESVAGISSGSSCYGLNRPKPKPKPVRTGKELGSGSHDHQQQVKSKKSRALKIYGDLKKAKQPISPGGRLASFLNSLFTAKKAKISSDEDRKVKSANASTCSSASSFSRSCLSKNTTPSSRTAGKRSVRFYPVSVIVDEDSRPCGHKNLDLSVKEELQLRVTEKNRRVEEAARDLLRNYQKKVEREFDLRNGNVIKNLNVFEDEDDDDDDDAASYSSSDLFELDNLSAIGMERYSQELPVYETTHLHTNRAIANGLIL